LNHAEGQSHNKLLGVLWDSQADKLLVDLAKLLSYANSLPITKQSILKISTNIFDPLGLLSSFIVRLKLLFRSLCSDQVNWDDPVEGEILTKWGALIHKFRSLGRIRVPRCYFDSFRKPVLFELMVLVMHQLRHTGLENAL